MATSLVFSGGAAYETQQPLKSTKSVNGEEKMVKKSTKEEQMLNENNDDQPVFDETGEELATQEIVPTTASLPAPVQDQSLLFDRVAVVHGTTEDVPSENVGKFMNKETNEVFQELQIIPIKVDYTRALWIGERGKGIPPKCKSNDSFYAVEADDRYEPWYPGQACKDCKHNYVPWKPREGVEQCKPSAEVLAFDLDAEAVISIHLSANSLRAARLMERDSVSQKKIVRLVPFKAKNTYRVEAAVKGPPSQEQREHTLRAVEPFLPAAA
jgi:hypothetical protein